MVSPVRDHFVEAQGRELREDGPGGAGAEGRVPAAEAASADQAVDRPRCQKRQHGHAQDD